jgi:TRAP-type C4-dicarboxylate transport system substrate-binding protein
MNDNYGWHTGDLKMDDQLAEYIHTHPLAQANLDKLNLVYGWTGTTRPSNLIAKKGLKRMEKVEDFAGLQFGTAGYRTLWAKELGMTPVTLPTPEFYEAMQKGILDMVPVNPVTAYQAFRLHEVAEYIIDVPLGVFCSVGIVNKDSWNSLPQYIQDLWRELAPSYFLDYNREIKAVEWEPAMEIWEPIGRYKLAPEEEDKVLAAMSAIWEAWLAEQEGFPAGKRVREFLKDQIAFRDKLTGKPWTIITP